MFNGTNYLPQSIKYKRWRVFKSIDAVDNRLLSIHYSAKISQEGSCLLSCHVTFEQLFYFLKSVHLDSISVCSATLVLQGRDYWSFKVLGTICQSQSSATLCWLKFVHISLSEGYCWIQYFYLFNYSFFVFVVFYKLPWKNHCYECVQLITSLNVSLPEILNPFFSFFVQR